MSLDKSIESGREKRMKYRGAKECDSSCRNHGSCPSCRENRLWKNNKRKAKSQHECEDCFDTGCMCGYDCDGCCHCEAAHNPST